MNFCKLTFIKFKFSNFSVFLHVQSKKMYHFTCTLVDYMCVFFASIKIVEIRKKLTFTGDCYIRLLQWSKDSSHMIANF